RSKITGYFSKARRTSEQADNRNVLGGIFSRRQNCQKILRKKEIVCGQNFSFRQVNRKGIVCEAYEDVPASLCQKLFTRRRDLYILIPFVTKGNIMRKKVFDGKLIKLFKTSKKLPNGKKGYFEEIVHPGASLIVPFIGDKVVLIRQYRGVIGKYILELPAGTLSKGETFRQCAVREVEEETGYKAKKITKIGYIYPSPGYCNEVIHIFRAECTDKGKTNMDADEVIKTCLYPRNAVAGLLKKGKFRDSKTIAALALAGLA
ncbi:MAG TPA: NUDIX hydrolase, partial [Candidatus Omnitrophota bacterium]|nr:NUDIX hydrolase [Candidatus Omnitrophota bacterium]